MHEGENRRWRIYTFMYEEKEESGEKTRAFSLEKRERESFLRFWILFFLSFHNEETSFPSFPTRKESGFPSYRVTFHSHSVTCLVHNFNFSPRLPPSTFLSFPLSYTFHMPFVPLVSPLFLLSKPSSSFVTHTVMKRPARFGLFTSRLTGEGEFRVPENDIQRIRDQNQRESEEGKKERKTNGKERETERRYVIKVMDEERKKRRNLVSCSKSRRETHRILTRSQMSS